MASARAIVCRAPYSEGGWKMEDVTVRQPGEGELLIEMVASGICHTDALIGGLPDGAAPIAFYPRVLGHEGSGYVEAVGPGVTVAAKGDPVLLSFAFCDSCAVCKAGHHSHCNTFTELNFGGPYKVFGEKGSEEPTLSGAFFGQSSFANLSIVKACSVVNVKDIVKDKRELQLFSPLGCGIQTGSGTVINAGQATADDVVCIMGLGGVGLSAIMGAKIQGCKTIIGVDRVESRLKLAKELGATHVVDGSKLPEGKSLGDVIKELAESIGPSITIDTTGVPALTKAGIDFTRNRGKFIQVGSSPFDFKLEIDVFGFMVSVRAMLGAQAACIVVAVGWRTEGPFSAPALCPR